MLILAHLLLAAVGAAPVAMPEWLPKAVEEVDRAMDSVESGRRLQASITELKLEPRRLRVGEPPVLYLPGERPVLAIDPERVKALKGIEFELALVRERARAARDQGVRLIESELSAQQAVLEYALDRAESSEEFGGMLRRSARKLAIGPGVDEEDSPAQPDSFELRLPSRDPDLTAELLLRFAKDPEQFYWAVERELLHAPGSVRLLELESFLWSYAERLGRVACPPPGRYCKLDGRLVAPPLVEAAKATLAIGGLDRLREDLGAFQSQEAGRLKARVRAWLRKL